MNRFAFSFPSIVVVVMLLFLRPGSSRAGEFPVGSLDATVNVLAAGARAELAWSVTLPDGADAGDFMVFLRQVQYPSMVVFDMPVELEGETISPVPLDWTGAKFELWVIQSEPLVSHLLDTTIVGEYVPTATVGIRSEDPYPLLPRTRADRPFHVDVTVEGLMDGELDPDILKSVTFMRHAQSYGAGGSGAGIDRLQAALISEIPIATNGAQTFTFETKAIPGDNSAKLRGEERFSIFSVADYAAPDTQIDSQFIQIWPVADGSIAGITEGQTIGPGVPDLTIALNDLYPDSSTWVQVYMGPPRDSVTGSIVPGSSLVMKSPVPENHVLQFSNYGSLFDSDGLWTLEVLTRTPFGTDRITAVSFTMQGIGMTIEGWRQAHFNSINNSGDGENLHDFDHDGIPNLIEFAFGLDPRHNSAGLLPTPVTEGNERVLRFTAPSAILGVTYAAQWSPNLATGAWTDIPDVGVPPEHVFRIPAGAAPSVFLQFQITTP